ncbi:MAG: superoxide dismutase [Ni] [Pirellulaceae bacterium]
MNQLVRWVNTKEDHASKIQHTIAQYFMTQRIKADGENYAKKLAASACRDGCCNAKQAIRFARISGSFEESHP